MGAMLLLTLLIAAQAQAALRPLDSIYPDLDALYRDLHRSPELSTREEKTSAKLAERLRRLGYEVFTNVGGYGVAGVLHNGPGHTLLLRTDMDALPVEEKTGLPYASHVTAPDPSGKVVPVMHACGHDLHMSAWVGAATLLAQAKDSWHGTLVMVGQPAEETGAGARAMLAAGLFQKVPKPDFAVAIHDKADLPSGKLGIVRGYALANVDSVDLTIYGKGGHGAWPQETIDPIVIAARTVVALQTIVARENNPFDPAVITVGSFHGGTRYNIIPDDVHLQLTVRSYKPEVRERLLKAIERIAKGEAAAAGATKEPLMHLAEGTSATYNDPPLTDRLAGALGAQLGKEAIVEVPPVMGGEDFGEFGKAAGVPSVLIHVGAVEPGRFEKAKASGEPLPPLHSSQFAPDRERTLRTAVSTLVISGVELLGR